MSNDIIPAVKGTRDFYPKDQAFQNWFYQNVKEISLLFGFQEYEGPMIEYLDLYAAKSGEELVKKQSFTFPDQSGKVIALRPEMTPSLARMIAQKSGELIFPIKWFTYGRRYRYEKPQKGRGREFFQWDCDIIGLENFEADAEIISLAIKFYQKLGLTPDEVKVKINDRKLLQTNLLSLQIPEEKILPVIKIADKKGKISNEELVDWLREEGLTLDQSQAVIQVLEEKNAYLKSEWLINIFELLKVYGVAEYVEFDPGVVRGLDYYTRTVFEGWDVRGELRAIWGGGRYDNLIAEVGGKQRIAGVGFAMGDMVMEEVLRMYNKLPQLTLNQTKVLVTIFSPDLYERSLELIGFLRDQNINTEIFPDPLAKIEKQLKYADKKQIPYAVIFGPEEISRDIYQLKNLSTKEQKVFTKDQLISNIK